MERDIEETRAANRRRVAAFIFEFRKLQEVGMSTPGRHEEAKALTYEAVEGNPQLRAILDEFWSAADRVSK